MLSKEQERKLMAETVQEAKKSVSEDSQIHPKVGALIATQEGQIVCRAHRGESHGAHAEFTLLEKAKALNVSLDKCVLFSSLEPCTERGQDKIPCVERVAATPIPTVYIGTLDPNPSITGRSEMFLTFIGKAVRRFEGKYQDQLLRINHEFFEKHRDHYVETFSLYMPSENSLWQPTAESRIIRKPVLSDERNSLLLQTVDLVFGSQGDVWRSAGGLSWFRECFLSFLCASLQGRQIRLLCSDHNLAQQDKEQFSIAVDAARSIGVSVGMLPHPLRVRCTVVSPHSGDCTVILVDKTIPCLYNRATDSVVVELILEKFERGWDQANITPSTAVNWEEVKESEMIEALSTGVDQYRTADIGLEEIDIADLRFLTQYLERFKLHRLQQMAAIRVMLHLPDAVRFAGCPWIISPPVIEVQRNGDKVIIDGAHRVYAAHLRYIRHLKALVVRGVDAPLPSRPVGNVSTVGYYDKKLTRPARYSDFNQENFREIRRAMELIPKSGVELATNGSRT